MKTRDAKSVSDSMQSGADDFVTFINQWGHPAWSVLAVKSSLEPVSKTYLQKQPGKQLLENVPLRSARDQDNEISPANAIVQIRDSAWIVVTQALCVPIDEDELNGFSAQARSLSAILKTNALVFSGDDTSYAMGFESYQNGKVEQSYEWRSQTNSTTAHFSELGVYFPACYPVTDGNEFWLAAFPSASGLIQSCNLIV